jgi:signal transduction histidine kinase/CheY-like chemotaxis protein
MIAQGASSTDRSPGQPPAMPAPAHPRADRLERLPLAHEQDLVAVRQRGRQVAALLGFDNQDQARIATAISEIARNAIRYATDGTVEFLLEGEPESRKLTVRIADRGPGIANLHEILDGRYRSTTGMGLGIVGARRLMDDFDIQSSSAGTVVLMKKRVIARTARSGATSIEQIRAALARERHATPLQELQQQQRELLVALADARDRQEQLAELNRELEDTNRGVVALYAELDEKAEHLRRADEMKSRFLSNMSHEFRTPLNSIRALAGLLLDRVDGPLSEEQQRQASLICKATDDLSNLVEDLLDLGRIEAGKLEIHLAPFAVDDLFSALRGMMRPLLAGDAVALRFEPAADVGPLYGDEAKVSQILRNFISNALKFTERGTVTVSARMESADTVQFCVEDSGIGIAPDDQQRIFEEFVQVRGPLQSRVKGTGLGLPLCRRLAHALGGEVRVESEPGAGSRFFLAMPRRHREPEAQAAATQAAVIAESWRIRVLVVADDPAVQLCCEDILRPTPYRPMRAMTLDEADKALADERPAAVILDTRMRGGDVLSWLADRKADPASRAIPMLAVANERVARAAAADAFLTMPIERIGLLDWLTGATQSRVLIIEDDVATRYAMRRLLEAAAFLVLDAANGEDGLRAAVAARPRSIVLDLGLPDINGFSMLDRLKTSMPTQDVPVIVCTARDLTDAERATLEARAFAVLSKRDMLSSLVSTVAAASDVASVSR